MKQMITFASRFGARIALNPEFIVENANRYFLFNPTLRKVAKPEFVYAGLYLGKVKNGLFFPSFSFLNILAEVAANKVVLDSKAAWLFICGRDVFQRGVTKVMGSKHKGDFTLVLNEYGECLGYGMISGDFHDPQGRVVVRNVLDVGDFLRRED